MLILEENFKKHLEILSIIIYYTIIDTIKLFPIWNFDIVS